MAAAVSPIHAQQLSSEVGGHEVAPAAASIAFTGSGELHEQLYMDDSVVLKLVGRGGMVLGEFHGNVVGLEFKQHPKKTNKDGVVEAAYVERKHKIKLVPDE